MTGDLGLTATWVPDTCTLPAADRPLRSAEFDDVLRSVVTSVRRVDPTRVKLVLQAEPAVAARVAELATRETGCCSFFGFNLAIGEGTLVLEVRAPPDRIEVLDALVHRAEGAVRERATTR